ncbi:MAG: SHOCT domain-containing protein [Pseudodesulfovibrio sp.]
MKKMKTVALVVSLMAAFMLVVGPLAGCGSKKSSTEVVMTTTKGQQLQDLDEAYKKGILTEKEYEAEKKKILK